MFMAPKNTFSIKYNVVSPRHGSGYKLFKRSICFIIKSSLDKEEYKQIFKVSLTSCGNDYKTRVDSESQ